MSETGTARRVDSNESSAKRRRWLIASIVALASLAGLFVLVQRRAQSEARQRAKIEALRDLEQAKRDAEQAKKNLNQALDRMDQERKRIEKENRPYLDDSVLPQRRKSKDGKALRMGEPPPEPIGRKPRDAKD